MRLPHAIFAGFCAAASGLWTAAAAVTLGSPFTDHAVFQQGLPVPVWGQAGPGEKVTVTYQGQSATAIADQSGRWMAKLPAFGPKLSGPLTVEGENTIRLNDVVTGEVWLCAGQSNMAFLVRNANDAAAEIAAANYPEIREFKAATLITDEPQATVPGQWQVCNPDNAGEFSAVGYYFARDLYKALQVPIGIITAADGGTIAETWTSLEALRGNPKLAMVLERWNKELQLYPKRKAAYDAAMVEFNKMVAAGGLGNPPKLPPGPGHNDSPGGHFNAMINPLIPYAMRGALWYQGESNAPRASEYQEICQTMIRDWQSRWGLGAFPFLIIQLPRHLRPEDPTGVTWAWLREAQTKLLSLKNTGFVNTLDLGDTAELHPINKQDFGRRAADTALALVYGKLAPFAGPSLRKATFRSAEVTLAFDHAGRGLATVGQQPPGGFQIAGKDKKFHDATARIEGESVVVSSPEVPKPAAVRYAWTNDPVKANLINGEGLPAVPFRTDDWAD